MNKLHIVMYHYVRDLQNSRYPNIKGMDYKLFKQQILFLKENFHIVTMEEVIESAYSQNKYLPKNALLLTFDDGYIDNYTTVLPILKENGLQGSFFIPGKTFSENVLLDVNKIHFVLASVPEQSLLLELYKQFDYYRGTEYPIMSNAELWHTYGGQNTRFDSKEIIFIKRMLQTVLPESLRHIITSNLFHQYIQISEDKFARELYMNRDQIRYMHSVGMFIGLHGYDHYWLGNLEKENMQLDISRAMDVMDEFIDRDAWVMNYPYGSYNDDVIQYVKSRGCKIGLTTDVRVADVNMNNIYELPRLDCNDFPPKSLQYLEGVK